MKMKFLLLATCFLITYVSQAQYSVTSPPENWQHLDKLKDGIMGVSADKMYSELLQGKSSETIIVAVIDSGVDHKHEDLKDVMWHNPGEIPANGIDDDGNGYVDDVYGWNFIGGKNGENVHHDQLEATRLYKVYRTKFKNVDPSSLSKKDKKLYDEYLEMGQSIKEEREEAAENAEFYGNMLVAVDIVINATGKEDPTLADMKKMDKSDPRNAQAVQIVSSLLSNVGSVKELRSELEFGLEHFKGHADYYYNPDIEVRSIVGDNYADSSEKYYGNNDVKGPDAMHGTHVAGLIAATRKNGVGMDGIANNVKIMAIRCVPDGDERDKDVANSIIYAVDNGASIINMSFGKGQSWDKAVVDKAVKYAMKNDVLLVHAAGNDGNNIDIESNFPNDKFEKKGLFGPKKAKNWLEIGALSWKGGEETAGDFSNYGKENVDLFSPGVDVYSTKPENTYGLLNGTSMAAPVAAGVAAVIRSYYPELSATQVKDIIMSTTTMTSGAKVKQPGSKTEVVPFADLCVSGGAINGYEAVKKAEKVKPKKKKNKWRKSGMKAAGGKASGKKSRV